MRLTDFLQLTNDLNEQTSFYLTISDQQRPLAKLKISANACLLYPGQKPLTRGKIISLVKNLHGRDIPVYIQNNEKLIPVYGIQLRPAENAVWLT